MSKLLNDNSMIEPELTVIIPLEEYKKLLETKGKYEVCKIILKNNNLELE